MTDADCPLNPLGHKYFLFATKTDYEPADYYDDKDNSLLFKKVEYAILSCNCSSVLRVRVKKQ